jgi:hypothetical protein
MRLPGQAPTKTESASGFRVDDRSNTHLTTNFSSGHQFRLNHDLFQGDSDMFRILFDATNFVSSTPSTFGRGLEASTQDDSQTMIKPVSQKRTRSAVYWDSHQSAWIDPIDPKDREFWERESIRRECETSEQADRQFMAWIDRMEETAVVVDRIRRVLDV